MLVFFNRYTFSEKVIKNKKVKLFKEICQMNFCGSVWYFLIEIHSSLQVSSS